MPADLQRLDAHRGDKSNDQRKKGIVTGIRDCSEVESMIQRYLELAHSALKEDAEAPGKSA
jgi:hypothetical protein